MRRGKKLLSTLTTICIMVSSLLINSVLPGSVINVQASGVDNETVNVPFELDFNNLTIGTVPEGWTEDAKHASQDAGLSSMTVVDDSETAGNKLVKFEQTTARSKSQYYMHYNFTGTSKAVLEYRFKTDNTSNKLWLPAFTYGGVGSAQPLFLLFQNGALQYSVNCSAWCNAVTNMTEGWHTVKMVVDLTENVRELYVDGNQITLNATHMADAACKSDKLLSSVAGGFYHEAEGSTYYVDDVKVSGYVSEDTVTIPFEVNFNDMTVGTVPEGWTEDAKHASQDAGRSSMTVVDDSETAGNKLVKFEQATARSKSQYYMHYNFTGTNKAVLEYRFKTDNTSNKLWLPAFTYGGIGATQPLFLLFQNGALQYSVNCSAWCNAVTNMTEGWHTVKMVVDLTENVRELYVDGNQITLNAAHMADAACKSDKLLSSVAGGFYHEAEGSIYYIDDVKVSEYVSEDTVTIPFEVNFNDMTVDTVPEGWTEDAKHASQDAGRSSMTVVDDSETAGNKLVKFEQATARSKSQYYMHYNFAGTNKAVLEYRFKTDSTSNNLWLPAFTYGEEDGSKKPLFLLYQKGTLKYSVNCSKWCDAVTNMAEGWHDVKLVVDLTQNVRELYVDGNQITLDATHMSDTACKTDKLLSSVAGGFYSEAEGSTYYVDDVKVSEYIVGENVKFGAEEYIVPKDGYIVLKPIFTPTNTTVQGMIYVSSNPEVATVDMNGLVTGVAHGEATITATPVLANLAPITTTVKVQGEVSGTITVVPAELALPVGGHIFLQTSLNFDYDADDKVLYSSANPAIATVDEWGEVVAVAAGTTTITACAAANSDISVTIPVTIDEASIWKTIYVSANGTGDGTSESTPTTIAGALNILENIDKSKMTGNIEVILQDGYYYQSEPIALSENHGGNNIYTVVFKAADGADVTIGGGIQINGSEFSETDVTGIYVVSVPSGTQTRQMFVDNVRATRARSHGTLTNAEFLYDEAGINIGIVCDNAELLNYTKPEVMELVYSGYWQHARVGVSEIKSDDNERVQLIMDQPSWEWAQCNHASLKFEIGKIDYFENALELLDEPGEWYLDETESKLYYMPRSWEDMQDVTVTLPVLDAWDADGDGQSGLMTIVGSDYDNMVKNIRFDGITFADVTWMRPSTTYGHIAHQNNHIMDGQVGDADYTADAAITVKRANSISFINCDFTRHGIIALKMTEGVQNSMITGNHFYDISGNAIQIGEPNFNTNVDNYNPSDIRKMMKNCDITNNYIHDIGVDFQSSAAIGVGFAANMDMSHNEIFNVPYSGFSVGYGWGAKFDNIQKNMNISYNFIHDYMYGEVFDGAGVYVLGNTAGNNVISKNYMRNQGNHPAPLYLDNGSTNWIAENNVIDTAESPLDSYTKYELAWVKVNPPASDLYIRNNYSTSKTSTISKYDTLTNVAIENHCIVTDLNWPTEALNIIAESGIQSAYESLRNNQAERIVTNLSKDETFGLDLNETYQLNVTATDGKDRAVSMNNSKVIYEILDETVATVSDLGLITAVGAGDTVLRIYVISNDILDVVEKQIYVNDALATVALEEVTGDITLFTVPGTSTQLKAYGLTEKQRKLTLSNVIYETVDDSVAVVSELGVLEYIGVGETILTVTGTAEGKTVSTSYNVVVKSAGTVSYMDDIFEADNQQYWVGSDLSTNPSSTWTNVDGVSIFTELNGWRNYTGRKYGSELLTFNLGIKPQMTWPSIYLRVQESNTAVGLGATGYIICFTDKGMQLQRFNGGNRTVIYGIIDGANDPYIVGPNVTPYALEDGELHKIQVGAINEGDGVRLLMYIDGEEIFNYHDTAEGAIREDGYFGLIGTGSQGKADKFTFVKIIPEIDITVNNTAEVDGVEVTAPIGGWKQGENTFTVLGDKSKACVVAVKNAEGKYVRLEAVETGEEGVYKYTVDDATADTEIVVAIAGDTNGDGQVNASDVTMARAASLGNVTLDNLSAMLADANGDGSVNAADATLLRAVSLGSYNFAW